MDFMLSSLTAQPATFWLVIVLYTFLLIGISFYFLRFVKNTDDFFLGGRHTPWTVAGLSFFMTAFSASVFVADASFTYRYGGLSLLKIIASAPIFIIGFFLFAPRWHRTGYHSAIDFIENRYGQRTGQFFLWTGIPIRILDNANRMYVTAVLIHALLGVELLPALTITAVITLISTVAGGFLAVVVTDALQAFVMGVIVLIVSVLAWNHLGGIQGFLDKIPESYWTLNPAGSDYNISFIMAIVFIQIFSWNGYWSLVQRYVSVRTEADSRKVMMTGGISFFVLFPLFAILPMMGAALIPGLEGSETEQIYFKMAQMLLPAGLLGLLTFAIFGATITALNSELNVIAQVLVENSLVRHLPNLHAKVRLAWSRIICVIVMAICMAIAIQIPNFGGAFKFLMNVMGMTILPTYMPILFGLLYRKTPGWGAMSAFAVGITTSVLLKFGLHWPLAGVVAGNGFMTALVFFSTGIFWPVKGARKQAVEAIFQKLKHRGSGDELIQEGVKTSRQTNLPLLGWSMVILAVIVLLTLAWPAERASMGIIIGTAIALSVTGSALILIPSWANRKEKA